MCGCGTSFTILHPLHRNQTNPEMFIGLVTGTPERLTDQKQRWIGLSAEQEPLETQKGHVSTTQCHRALAPALIGKIVAPEVPGLLEQPFAFSHTLSKNMAQSWHLESRMCQAVKLHPCSACFALSIAFGCEREAPACKSATSLFVLATPRRLAWHHSPLPREKRQRWREDGLEERAWLLISSTWRK